MVTISLFQKKIGFMLVFTKAKSRTEFPFERGGGGQGRSEKYFTSLASRYFLRRSLRQAYITESRNVLPSHTVSTSLSDLPTEYGHRQTEPH